MKRFLIGLIALCPLAAAAREGRYRGPTNDVEITRLSGDRYRVVIGTWRAPDEPPCAGEVRATARIPAGATSAVARANNGPDPIWGRYCSVRLRFRGARTLEIEEGRGCLGWRGISCGFTGTLTRR